LFSSLVPQGDQRIYAGGAACGNVAGGEGYKGKQGSRAKDRERIVRADVEEEIREIASKKKGTAEAKGQTEENHDETLTEDQTKNL